MEGLLPVGKILTSESGNKYKITKFLGAGGQGEVYDVECDGKHYALKWYFKSSATDSQKKILDKLIEKGSPTKEDDNDIFLWPEDLIYNNWDEPFGYIMELREKQYKGIVDLMKCRISPSFENLVKACYNLTKGYYKLHEQGYQYRDISFGNAFFDPNTGDVKICDNDNVTPSGSVEGGVKGTPRFMAPEIVRGEAKPSRNTDRFSLAVLLFYMLMVSHPLEGNEEAKIKCMDPAAMLKLYGTNPIFIYDPDNKTNRPKPGYHDNALIYWNMYPQYIKDLFIQSFTIGLNTPAKRVTEAIWKQYGTTLLGLFISNNFIFAFQLGDGDITYVDGEIVKSVIEGDKMLGVETHSISKRDSWTKVHTKVINLDNTSNKPFMYILSTDGWINSHVSDKDFHITCKDYFNLIKEHGSETIDKNIPTWLSETSEQGCGDDITVVCAYFS